MATLEDVPAELEDVSFRVRDPPTPRAVHVCVEEALPTDGIAGATLAGDCVTLKASLASAGFLKIWGDPFEVDKPVAAYPVKFAEPLSSQFVGQT